MIFQASLFKAVLRTYVTKVLEYLSISVEGYTTGLTQYKGLSMFTAPEGKKTLCQRAIHTIIGP